MATPPLVDFESLLAPISGDNPAGDSLPFAIREKLDEGRKEINPDLFDADDPLRPDKPKKADWPGIIRIATDTLTDTSKDLLAASRLTEGLTKQHGFAGLRDGLKLMRQFLEDCWDRIYPSIEDGDLEVRAGAFNWLDDPERGARFPITIRTVPIVTTEAGGYSWLNWKQMLDGKEGGVTAEQFDKAVEATTLERCKTLAEDVTEAQAEVEKLTEVLTAKLGEFAPGMSEVRRALAETGQLIKQIREKKGPDPDEEPPAAPEDAAGESEAGDEDGQADEGGNGDGAAAPARGRRASAPARQMVTRDHVYQQLKDAANLLQKLEPHSPIPYLIQRAIELGAMPFPQLMKALIRDENVLTELNRELGIREKAAVDRDDD